MEEYSILILGIPTWDFGELQEDWEAIWPQLTQLNLREKLSLCMAWAINLVIANGSLMPLACCTTILRRWV